MVIGVYVFVIWMMCFPFAFLDKPNFNMKSSCIVPGCHNHSDNGKAISFYSFPADETLRQIWADWVQSLPVSHNTVLSDDFEEGNF